MAAKRSAKGKKPAAPKRERHYHEDGAYARRMAKRQKRDEDAAERESDDAANAPGGIAAGYWWTREGKDLTDAAWGWVERLRSRNRRQAMMDALWEAVYKDTPIGQQLDSTAALLRTRQSRQNIVMSMVDTLRARIGKRRPMPVISADDAGTAEKLFAKRASRVLRRKMGRSQVERMCPLVVRDGLIRGTGVVQVFRDGGDVSYERVPRREIIVDPAEAQYGEPRTIARHVRRARSVLAAMYPSRAADIEAAPRAALDEWRTVEEASDADLVDVIDIVHLPSAPDADDGKHAICIKGKPPLFCEPWTRPRSRYAFFQWNEALDGFWGTGLVEHAAPIQQEVNSMLRDMGEGIALGMQLKVFVPRGSKVEKNHLRARNPAVIEHDGAQPQYVAPLPFNPAVLSYLQWRIQQAYEMAGVSQASAASKSSLGNNASGKALDTQYDIESDRFSHVELQYAMFRVDLGMLTLDEARALYEEAHEKPDADDADRIKVDDLAPWIAELEWDKIEIDGGCYHLVLEPINFLPDARSGKLAQVNEAAKAGLIPGTMPAAALFDEPDIARANRYILGPYKMLERWCEDLADESVPLESLVPTPQHIAAMPLTKDMCQGELDNQIAEAGYPPKDEDERIQERYRWALKMLEGEASGVGPSMPAAPQMPAPGAMPPMGGPPMPPPGPGADPMGGLTSQLAAGMPAPQGMVIS